MGEASGPHLPCLDGYGLCLELLPSGERQMDLISCFRNSSIKVDGFWNPWGRFRVSLPHKSTYFTKIPNKKIEGNSKPSGSHSYYYRLFWKWQESIEMGSFAWEGSESGDGSSPSQFHFGLWICVMIITPGLFYTLFISIFHLPLKKKKERHLLSTCFLQGTLSERQCWVSSGVGR